MITYPLDQLISIFIELLEISPDVDESQPTLRDYHRLLKPLLPGAPIARFIHRATVRAFHHDSKEGRDVTTPVYEQILSYYEEYSEAVYLAPYVSIVGPCGIGKSFVVQQIARQGHAYVVYASLAMCDSDAYPSRSVIAA